MLRNNPFDTLMRALDSNARRIALLASLVEREYPLPVFLHVHYRPTVRSGIVESLIKLANGRCAGVAPFALGVGVTTCARVGRNGTLEI
jgi:hypothetical protein